MYRRADAAAIVLMRTTMALAAPSGVAGGGAAGVAATSGSIQSQSWARLPVCRLPQARIDEQGSDPIPSLGPHDWLTRRVGTARSEDARVGGHVVNRPCLRRYAAAACSRRPCSIRRCGPHGQATGLRLRIMWLTNQSRASAAAASSMPGSSKATADRLLQLVRGHRRRTPLPNGSRPPGPSTCGLKARGEGHAAAPVSPVVSVASSGQSSRPDPETVTAIRSG
jgi:hypothetical protein